MRSVLYLRMSTDKQETSIADQRNELQKHAAAKGYRIVGEYADEGISGDATEKRIAFQRMVADCGKKRFDLILCWDQDRFGRFDPLEGGYWIKPIRDAGVQLETIAQGRIDWSDFASRLVWTVTQEAKHAYLRTLARDTTRGMISAINAGMYPGIAPFGYRKKDKRLIPGPPEEVETVRKIFHLKASGMGYRNIAWKLTGMGIPAPGNGKWTQTQVRYIVNRESYCGRTIFGRAKRGKYTNIPAKMIVENTHEPLITEEEWNAAQASKRESFVKYRTGRIVGALNGLMTCGMCGARMYHFKRTEGYGYVCGRYHRAEGCGFCHILETKALELIAEEIRKVVGTDVEELKKEIEAQRLAKRKRVDTAELARKIADLDRQIERAVNRMLSVDDQTFAILNSKVQELRDARDVVVDEIEASAPMETFDAGDAANRLCDLPRLILKSSPEVVRASLAAAVESITLNYRQQARNCKRRFFDFISLEIKFRE